MFGKIFAQIFDSSIVERPDARVTFMDMIVLADADGVVDMTHAAIARRTNRPLDVIRKTIAELESPDPESRTEAHDGRRIARLDAHRDWGWFIVNYQHFRDLASAEQKREGNRKRAAKWRVTHSNADVTPSNANNAIQIQIQKQINKEEAAEKIYQAYPRKVGKPNAIRAIRKAFLSTPIDELLAKTQAYARARACEDPNFTPHPATWFNRQSYNDDPATWAKQLERPKDKFKHV